MISLAEGPLIMLKIALNCVSPMTFWANPAEPSRESYGCAAGRRQDHYQPGRQPPQRQQAQGRRQGEVRRAMNCADPHRVV
ncbi:MAG TPA: hypothetical protein VFA32_03365 [Dehalococcoidia bacterium]|nr:hypothetical protein [Dehalococcoidia bacterium]